MTRWLLLGALLLASCSQAETQPPDAPDAEPGERNRDLITAVQSTSLQFPLHFDPDDDPPGFIKVVPEQRADNIDNSLMEVLAFCGTAYLWFDQSSHSMSVMMPSAENVIWAEAHVYVPSDDEMIECIRNKVRKPFFYRELPKGTDVDLQPTNR